MFSREKLGALALTILLAFALAGATHKTFGQSRSGVSPAPSFVQSGTGAIGRPVTGCSGTAIGKACDVLNGRDFGMKCDDATDDQAALQKAVTAATASAKTLELPGGTCRISSAINVTGALYLRGAGRVNTYIKLTSATINGFNITSDAGVRFQGVTFTASGTQSAGAAIKLDGATPGTTLNDRSSFYEVECQAMWRCLESVGAHYWVFDSGRITGILDAGIYINNTTNGDAGDNKIVNSLFAGDALAGSKDSIRHARGGGLIVANNKFQINNYAYHWLSTNTVDTSQVTLIGNHVEPQVSGGFIFERSSGTSTLAGVHIIGNYIAAAANAAINNVGFLTNNNLFVFKVVLSGNTYSLGASGVGIQIAGGAMYEIAGEIFHCNAGTSTAITTSNATGTGIHVNNPHFYSCTNNYSFNTATQMGGGPFRGSASYNLASLAAGATTNTSVTVPGAVVGDMCKAGFGASLIGGISMTASVTAANTATVTFMNNSAGAWAPGTATLGVSCERRPTWSNF